ncbi:MULTISPECIES: MFS transporter [Gordonia]|uniref:MFS transporter n=1 Tax=Gordonia TaxID=2053 RepID=UPI0003FD2EBC|nr:MULTISPECIES: MFS transporter [Gordonia]KAF0969595.1 Hexuronate transporter [Gordonia sp. YY1]MCR8896898.1 MFS transporter [Gordonia sp. GONU]MCZ0912175.1 MFS transporter [Gordonia amicalis]MCZ4651707.1 MFS transporter [Gordonia amicalis]
MTVTTASGSGSGKDPAAAPTAPDTTEFEVTPGRFGGLGPLGESRLTAWGLTSLLVSLYVINYADKAVLGIIAKPLREELGLSASQIGLVGSLFFLTFTIGGFFAGLLNRWMTLRWSLVLLGLCWAAAMLPMIAVAGFAVLLISRLLLGLSEGPTSALLHTAAYAWHPPARRALPGALLAGAASIAKIAIAPLLTVITVSFGWRWALFALAAAGAVWAVVWLSTWRPGPYIASGKTKKVDETATGETSPADAEPATPWVKIFLAPTFITGALLVMSVYALVSVVLTWLPSYFEDGLGYSQLQSGSMFAFPSIVGLVLMLLSSITSDRMITKGASPRVLRVVVPSVGVLISGVLLFLLPSISTPMVCVLILSVGYGFAAMVFPLLNAAIAEICPPRQTAGTLGVFLAIMAIGGLVAPYATGVIVDAAATPAEGYATAFQVLGLVASVCAVLALIFANPARDRTRLRPHAVLTA